MTLATAAPYIVLVGLISIAAVVNGMVGFGFALLALNALALVLDAKNGVIVMSLMAPMMSGSQLWHHRRHLTLDRRLWGMVIAALLGSVVGTRLLVLLPTAWVSLGLGLFTLYFVLSSLREERPPMTHTTQRWLGPVAGAIGGITNGALGASGPIFGTYLTAIGLRGRDFAVAISVAFFAMGVLRVGLLAGFEQYTAPLVGIALLLLVPSIIVQRVGFHLQGRLDRRTVYRTVLVVLAIGGVNLVVRGLLALP